MDPGYALGEWQGLASLAEELGKAAEQVRGIHGRLGRVNVLGIERIWRRLERMSQRWEQRAEAARRDAITDAGGDSGWIEAHDAKIGEALAISALARGLNDVEKAERLLWRDSATAERIREWRVKLDELYAEIQQRDPTRSFR
jgi:hypothetical protein